MRGGAEKVTRGQFRLSEDLSGRVLSKSDRLGPVLSNDGVVEIPVRIGGTASAPDVQPDMEILAERAAGLGWSVSIADPGTDLDWNDKLQSRRDAA